MWDGAEGGEEGGVPHWGSGIGVDVSHNTMFHTELQGVESSGFKSDLPGLSKGVVCQGRKMDYALFNNELVVFLTLRHIL